MSKYSNVLVPASIKVSRISRVYLSSILTSVFKLLQLQVEQQRHAHEESAKNDNMWIGVAPTIKNRASYTDFIAAQTKVIFHAILALI